MSLNGDELKHLRILIVDDGESNVLLLRRMLERAGYTQVRATTDPRRAPAMFLEMVPDLVLLDLHMPEVDGFELMEALGALIGPHRTVPFLILTADATEDAKRRVLSLGGRDFLTKPFDQVELLLRVRNVLEVQLLQNRLREHNQTLEDRVAARTSDLEQARLEILDRLALAAEYRDDATQQHAWRIGRTCALLATQLGLPDEDIELIRRAAPLHDVGKIGIPDSILLKPGKLTDAEFGQIKRHTTIGASILSGSGSRVLRMAERIALTHHERWDGSGYPRQLAGEEIPVEGRITAVADVFDALTQERPYKSRWPIEAAVSEILSQASRQFDPDVVEGFSSLPHGALLTVVERFASPSNGHSPRTRMAHA